MFANVLKSYPYLNILLSIVSICPGLSSFLQMSAGRSTLTLSDEPEMAGLEFLRELGHLGPPTLFSDGNTDLLSKVCVDYALKSDALSFSTFLSNLLC